jgi:hypothetical protein
MAAFALTVGCTSAGAAPPAATSASTPKQENVPNSGKLMLGGPEEVWVDSSAIPDKDPVTIQRGMTDVLWLGGKGVKNVLIFFKAECKDPVTSAKPPVDPPCQRDECLLDKASTAHRVGTFCYTIVVVRDDGTVEKNDPKLIIRP